MKRIFTTVLLIFVSCFINMSAQVNSTGLVQLDTDLAVQIDIRPAEVTLTMSGLSDRWFAVGFGGTNMGNVMDVAYNEAGPFIDGRLTGFSRPLPDDNQDWTEVSNTISAGIRTIVATRALSTGTDDDFTFSLTDASINLIWAFGANNVLAYHNGNRGATAAAYTLLNTNEFNLDDRVSVIPNPSNGKITILSAEKLQVTSISVYDVLGRKVKVVDLNSSNTTRALEMDLSNFSTGMYHLILETEYGKAVKKIVIQ